MPKVITGITRCGKSYTLNKIFKSYLKDIRASESNIICIGLTKISNAYYRTHILLIHLYYKFKNDKKI
ncbi:MAG: AAA family ATPase [Bacilli bacterium]|nr:AAA family ATPase [Bacilli bacterium]